MDPLFWSIVCVVLMLCMVVVELLTPSMGGFTLAALFFSGASVFAGFRHSESAGWLMLAVNVVLFPSSVYVCFKFLKKSPIVHQFDNRVGAQEESGARALKKLAGEIGKTLTPLRPSGTALINDARVDVMTDGKFVDAGVVVRVIRVSGSNVIVEPVS